MKLTINGITQYVSGSAWYQDFGDGTSDIGSKGHVGLARPFRSVIL